jgi:hypothetical protein
MPPDLVFQSLSSCLGKRIKPDERGSDGLKIGTMRLHLFLCCSAIRPRLFSSRRTRGALFADR